jgi:hypothetical protein
LPLRYEQLSMIAVTPILAITVVIWLPFVMG